MGARAQGPQGPWAQGPMGPWAHGPKGPWAHGTMGPKAHGPMTQGPWAHGPYRGPWPIYLGPWALGPWALYLGVSGPIISVVGPVGYYCLPDKIETGPGPKTDIFGSFLRGAKRFWPLRPPIGLRFDLFAIIQRGLTLPGDGFGLKRPMARDRHPAIFRIFGPPSLAPYYSPIGPFKGHGEFQARLIILVSYFMLQYH